MPPMRRDHDSAPNLRTGRDDLHHLIWGSPAQQAMSTILATPTPEGLGVSPYGLLGFDQRFMLELEALELTGERMGITDSNCPVVRSMMYQIEQQEEISRHADEMKKLIREKVQENRKGFEDRVTVRANWEAALRRYLQTQHHDVTRPAKKRKPKQPQFDEDLMD
jgi:hypothetical protein